MVSGESSACSFTKAAEARKRKREAAGALRKTNTTGHKGVCWRHARKVWEVKVREGPGGRKGFNPKNYEKANIKLISFLNPL